MNPPIQSQHQGQFGLHGLRSAFFMKPAFLFFLYATLLTLAPAIPFWFLEGWDAAFLFLTGDSYLYLGIAENSTADFFTFDGEQPTNGFHPLWQFYLRFVAQLTGDNSLALMNVAVLSGIVCCWLGVMLLGAAIAKQTGSWILAGLVVPGVYFLLVGQGVGGSLSIWGFFSGMEDGLAFALTGAIALLVMHIRTDENRVWFWLGLGLLTGLLMMCRLDDVFVSACIGVMWLIWQPDKIRNRLKAFVLIGTPPAMMLFAYFLFNFSYMEILMPISGSAKADNGLISNGWVTLISFFAPLMEVRTALTDYTPNYSSLGGAGFRVSQVVFPVLFASAFMVLVYNKHRDAPWAPVIAGMCAAIVLKAIYNFVFVNYWHQASWYYAFAQGSISLTAALLLAPAFSHWRQHSPLILRCCVFFVVAISFQQASKDYLSHGEGLQRPGPQAFYEARTEIDATLDAVLPAAKVIEFGDGIVGFSLDRHVRHGFVFAGDLGSLKALREGALLQHAYDQGYRIMTSYQYYRWPDVSLDKSSQEIREHLSRSGANYGIVAELENFDFEVVYVYEPLKIPFITFSPKG